MHLFDRNGEIKHYASPMDVVEEHFPVRLAMYAKRRDRKLSELDARARLLENKARFVGDVIDGQIKLGRSSKSALESELVNRGFVRRDDGTAADGNGSGSAGTAPAVKGGYEYLLNIPLHALTSDTIASTAKDIAAVKGELAALKAETPETLWVSELRTLKTTIAPSLLLQPHRGGAGSPSAKKPRRGSGGGGKRKTASE